MKEVMDIRHIIAGLLAAALATTARAQTNIEQRLDELEQEIWILKRQRELDQERADQKATAVFTAGKEGFALKSADGNFELKLRGLLQADGRFFLDDEDKNGTDTFLIRKARPILEGTLYKEFDFRLMPDFGNDTVALFDAYAEWKHWPWLKIRAGKFKPPVGLELLQEDPNGLFAERALPTALVPSRDIGVV